MNSTDLIFTPYYAKQYAKAEWKQLKKNLMLPSVLSLNSMTKSRIIDVIQKAIKQLVENVEKKAVYGQKHLSPTIEDMVNHSWMSKIEYPSTLTQKYSERFLQVYLKNAYGINMEQRGIQDRNVFYNVTFSQYPVQLLPQAINKHQIDTLLPSLGQLLNKQRETGLNCDVTFKVGNMLFKAHRAVLSAQSTVFERMLSGQFKESDSQEVVIEEIGPTEFGIFLNWLYTYETEPFAELSVEQLDSIAHYAHGTGIDLIQKTCANYMLDKLTEDTFFTVCHYSYRYKDSIAIRACINFIAQHENFYKKLDFGSLDKKNLIELLKLSKEILLMREDTAPNFEKMGQFAKKLEKHITLELGKRVIAKEESKRNDKGKEKVTDS